MHVPPGSRQSTAFAQAADTSDGTLSGTPLDGPLLWLILTREVVPGA